ncbi:MAG: hypothetical protein HOI92_03565 [Alphaproteobacteria bacterium]|jgi:hypothetical protein|nr:hypothetical protein [Alphaproteobacteria bacterium]
MTNLIYSDIMKMVENSDADNDWVQPQVGENTGIEFHIYRHDVNLRFEID